MQKKASAAEVSFMWKRFLLYEQAMIAKHGLDEYFHSVVFVIDKEPKPNCKHCYGRGYTGKDIKTGRVTPCGCLSGFSLRSIVDLKNDELCMDFDGKIAVMVTKEEKPVAEDAEV